VLQAASAQDVHQFWFTDAIGDPQAAKARGDVWFRSSRAFDEEVRQRFAPTIAAAARGGLSSWEEAPRSCVALVIVLDQFPRNVYRNTAAAFEHDRVALTITRRAIAMGYLDDDLSIPECAFLLMPYQHVENEAMQHEGIRLFERMAAIAPAEWRPFAENTLQFARRHLDIIDRFGRFPHRNALLGRESTPAEREYLASKPETFGQGGE
jgi:uncharacterized protein (DUF924 family)